MFRELGLGGVLRVEPGSRNNLRLVGESTQMYDRLTGVFMNTPGGSLRFPHLAGIKTVFEFEL